MDNDQLAKWTAIVTNIAVVIGLIFVGLEFRNNTKTLEIERLDHYAEGMRNNSLMLAKSGELANIFLKAHKEPGALTPEELFRYQQYLLGVSSHIERLTQYNDRGLLPDDLWEREIAGVGFMFSGEEGLRLLKVMDESNIDSTVWSAIGSAALEAKAYCADLKNDCMAPFQ